MTPDRSHSGIIGRVANKIRVEGGEASFNSYFYVPKYPSSDALPAPEIFSIDIAMKKYFYAKVSLFLLTWAFFFYGGFLKPPRDQIFF